MPAAKTRADALTMRFSGRDDTGGPRAVGTIPGVTVIAAAGLCGEGIAALASHNDGFDLCFRAPGSAIFGEQVRCAVDGDYLLEDGEDRNLWARVRVRTAFMAPTPQQARVFLKFQPGYMLNADKAPSTLYTALSLLLKNQAVYRVDNVRVWSPTPNTTFNLGSGDTAAPDEASSLLVGSISAGATRALNMKLTTGASASPREILEVGARWDSF